MDKRLRIILELVSQNFSSGVKGITGAFKGFVRGVLDGAASAGKGLLSLAQNVFFLREAFTTLINVARSLWDTFVGGAQSAAKLEAKLQNVIGNAEDTQKALDLLRQISLDTGADFETLAQGASLLAVAAKDASGNFDFEKFQRLQNMLQRMAALRPDVPIDRLARGLSTAAQTGNWQSLEMFLDVNLRQLLGLADAADEVAKIPGKVGGSLIYVETETSKTAEDAILTLDQLDEALKKAGATQGIIEDVSAKSGLERLTADWKDFANEMGGPVFDAINEIATTFADLYEADPEAFREIARNLGEGIASIIQQLASVDPEALKQNMMALGDALENVDFSKIGDDLQKIGESIASIADAVAKANEALATAQQLGFIQQQVKENPEIVAKSVGLPEQLPDFLKLLNSMSPIAGLGAGAAGAGAAIGGGIAGGEDLGRILKSAISEGVSEAFKTSKIGLAIDVVSNNELFDAHVRQAADGAVTDGLNAVAEELETQ
jgi:hypothetical protein